MKPKRLPATKKAARSELAALAEQIEAANTAYHQDDDPIMTDAAYDALVARARAIEEAFRYDSKVLIEEFVQGREIECSVLGNEDPIASVPGEVIPQHEFYSYEAKYLDENGAILKIPAELPEATVCEVQRLAVEAFRVLCCEGMARADFFLREDGEVLVNEINTIPGFTRISMYPKLWEASGLPYPKLLDRLIELVKSMG